MPGAPRSKRCQRCRQRKIKCDETWPCCTPCQRANSPCSGPSNTIRFIHDDNHYDHEIRPETSLHKKGRLGGGGLVAKKSQQYSNGSSFHCLQVPQEPRPNPTTVADRVALRFVSYLEKDAFRELLSSVGYTKIFPCRLGGSPVLRDCVAFFCSVWANFRRGVQLIDRNVYDKALKTLGSALNDPQEWRKSETLAAVTLMERFELLFDARRKYHRSMHGKGVYSLMKKRGPPNPDDELDVYLALENKETVVSLLVVERGENFYLTPRWYSVLAKALDGGLYGASTHRVYIYRLDLWFSCWPELVHEMRSVQAGTDLGSLDRALSLYHRILDMDAEIEVLGGGIISDFQKAGLIEEVSSPTSITESRYFFANIEAQRCMGIYLSIAIILNRMMCHLGEFLGQGEKATLEKDYKRLCYQTWMCLPNINRLGPLSRVLFVVMLYLSYEGADEAQTAYLFEWLVQTDENRDRLPKTPNEVKEMALLASRAITGRGSFATGGP
ncbi:hypothetical protein F4777DRAFT_594028 [Nemania sp. FL0916]|nr:hypothetical protein F4777DRAFT_594028 [Nemania sp. FL0916]